MGRGEMGTRRRKKRRGEAGGRRHYEREQRWQGLGTENLPEHSGRHRGGQRHHWFQPSGPGKAGSTNRRERGRCPGGVRDAPGQEPRGCGEATSHQGQAKPLRRPRRRGKHRAYQTAQEGEGIEDHAVTRPPILQPWSRFQLRVASSLGQRPPIDNVTPARIALGNAGKPAVASNVSSNRFSTVT